MEACDKKHNARTKGLQGTHQVSCFRGVRVCTEQMDDYYNQETSDECPHTSPERQEKARAVLAAEQGYQILGPVQYGLPVLGRQSQQNRHLGGFE